MQPTIQVFSLYRSTLLYIGTDMNVVVIVFNDDKAVTSAYLFVTVQGAQSK